MKIIEWRNIPSPRFPISYRYFFSWIKAPIKPFILTQICKINDDKIFVVIFKIINFFIFRWKIDVGDLIFHNQKIDHGVSSVDPDSNFDLNSFCGRITLNFSIGKFFVQ